MPFVSKAQERAAFGGYLGKEMQGRASKWAAITPKNIPEHVGKKRPAMPDIKKVV